MKRFLSLMQVSRAHVYLTYPFVLSWSLLEAMSAGAAILASDTPPVREVLTEDETGWMVDFFDRETLVNKLCELLDDGDTRKRLGENARRYVCDNFDLRTSCLPRQLNWVEHLAGLTPVKPQI